MWEERLALDTFGRSATPSQLEWIKAAMLGECWNSVMHYQCFTALMMYYRSQVSYSEIAPLMPRQKGGIGLTRERTRQVIAKGLRILRGRASRAKVL